ncbi:MAG TPA: exodeoxyribonuclease V subunit alpha [Dermatophilaceae bacterium]|nr:exodeoxyribonuclease V subunit alpha [Dermatophilaceae bacterium]
MTADLAPVEGPWDRRRATCAVALLRDFNLAGVLEPADVHVATRLGAASGEHDPRVLLAAALLVRAVRQGSVCLDLATVALTAPALGWPDLQGWNAAVRASPLTTIGVLREDHGLLYLDRYWQEEGQVCADVRRRRDAQPPVVDETRLRESLAAHFVGEPFAEQRSAAEVACRHWISVITGGPGTGKTTTIARFLGAALSASERPVRVALAAPTGKAAARLGQAVASAAGSDGFPGGRRAQVAGLKATTIHRLLGPLPGSSSRFRHHRGNPLPHDLVVIDETSMVSLTLTARLLDALRPDARLVLVGDADQLASVDAGAVLTDLVDGLGQLGDPRVARLRTSHRFGTGIAVVADAVRRGDAEEAIGALRAAERAACDATLVDLATAREVVVAAAGRLVDAAAAGDRAGAVAALDAHRLLCAHREGPYGVRQWNHQVEEALRQRGSADWLPQWYAGKPLLVTANDYGQGLYNGDTGVVTRASPGAELIAVIADGEHPDGRAYPLARLADVETAHAMTVHRSQGSQFDAVTVVLPEADSPLLTRELLYTALTRAKTTVRIVGSEDVVRAAVQRRARRASGLARRLTQGP